MSHPALDRVAQARRERGCWRRVTDDKRAWVWTGCGVAVAFVVVAAGLGVSAAGATCEEFTGMKIAAASLMAIAALLAFASGVLACCVASSEDEWRRIEIDAWTQAGARV